LCPTAAYSGISSGSSAAAAAEAVGTARHGEARQGGEQTIWL